MNHRPTALRPFFSVVAERIVIIALAAAASMVTTTANAGFMRPPIVLPLPIPGPIPPAPQVVPSPIGVQMANNSAAQSVTLRWYQPLMVATQAPVEAGAFVICLQAPAQACVWAASNPAIGFWSDIATGATFVRTPRYSTSSPFIANPPPPILQGYSYTATLSIANTLFDRDLKWTIGACAGPFTATCTFASPGSVWYSTKDLVGVAATIVHNATSNGRAISAEFSFSNLGSTDIGGFSAKYQVIEVLNAGGRCERNPALADPSFASVVLDNGTLVSPNDIPAGRSVNAIVKPGGDVSPVHTFVNPTTLIPGGASVVFGRPTNPSAAAHSFVWGSEAQRVYVLAATVDSGGTITEFNENNNGQASCATMTK